jgi:predicted nucleic acid-binding protein
VRFWDSSGVVPLVVNQGTSARAAAWLAEDPSIAIWTLTAVEVLSALRRLVREDALPETAARLAEARLNEFIHACHEIVDIAPVKNLATRLLRLHPLRAFDALQLGAALHWSEGRPQGRVLHTFDIRLAVAAQREGFVVPA